MKKSAVNRSLENLRAFELGLGSQSLVKGQGDKDKNNSSTTSSTNGGGAGPGKKEIVPEA